MALTRRLQILIDPRRYERLERAAQQAGSSVAGMIRQAIDRMLPEEGLEPSEALRVLLEAPPIPVGDWVDVEAELAEAMDRQG